MSWGEKVKAYFTRPNTMNIRQFGKMDAVLSIGLYLLMTAYITALLLVKQDVYLNTVRTPFQMLVDGLVYVPVILFVWLLVKFRKQAITSIGFRREGILGSILIASPMIVLFANSMMINGVPPIDIVFKLLYGVGVVGLIEEVVFRGYMYPRIASQTGRIMAIVICGLLFSLEHIPIQVIVYGKPFWDSVNAMVNIPGGIFIQAVMVYIYTRNRNILGPILIHGLLVVM